MRQKMPFCAPPRTGSKGLFQYRLGGSARGYLPTHSRSWPLDRHLVGVQRDRPIVFALAPGGMNDRICRFPLGGSSSWPVVLRAAATAVKPRVKFSHRHNVTDRHSGPEFSVVVRAKSAMPDTGRPAHELG